jgi:hypothetical protein
VKIKKDESGCMYGWKDKYMDGRMRIYGWELRYMTEEEWMHEWRVGCMDKGIKRRREEEGAEKEV